ncbi:MAG TPA: glycosyl hydrolase [Actinoplanes sp.]|nr:glycosyl hydrolase [Actinoplanes sp.]
MTYAVPSQWSGGFNGNVEITNLGDTVNGWTLTWTFPSGQTVANAWNATVSQSGGQVTAKNAGHNATISTNATVSFGFTGASSGSNTAPTSFTLNGTACTGSASGNNPPPPTNNPAPPTNNPAPPPSASNAFKGTGEMSCDELKRLGVTWWYNWYLDPRGCVDAGEYIPMVSGKDKHGPGDIAWSRDRAAEQAIKAGHKIILGFNEPDHTDQANMSVATAVSLWKVLTDPAFLNAHPDRQGLRFGSPAAAGDAGGRTWFDNFMKQAQAENLKIDFLTMHWYGWGGSACESASGFEDRINWLESFPGNRPIWITEFGCLNLPQNDEQGNDAKINSFYRKALEIIEKHPRVVRYAWYPWHGNNLIRSGNLTPVGNAFAAAPRTRGGGGNTGGGNTGREVTIVNRATGKCLDLAQTSSANGANIQQWDCHGGVNQKWRIEPYGDGTNRITSVASGKVLDTANCGTADGTNIQQFDRWDNDCQRWQTIDTDGGWFRLHNPRSGKVADVADCNTANGANVRLWSWLGNSCQQWQAR